MRHGRVGYGPARTPRQVETDGGVWAHMCGEPGKEVGMGSPREELALPKSAETFTLAKAIIRWISVKQGRDHVATLGISRFNGCVRK